MRSRTATWFECKVRYDQTQENGQQKSVTEQYVVDAISFAEAEARVTEQLTHYIAGDFEVTDVRKAAYGEIFFMDSGENNHKHVDTLFYKAKLQFITINEKTGKEKRQTVTYLVQACSLHNALDNIDTVMKGTMLDYVQASVSETAIIDAFEYVSE